MKHLSLAFALLATLNVFAQSGQVNYKRIVTLPDLKDSQIQLPEGLAALFPKGDTEQYVLYYSPDASLYETNLKAVKAPEEIESDGMHIRIEHDQKDEKYYTDLKNGNTVQQKDIKGRTFLIKESIKQNKWKMTGNQKRILDKTAMEATMIRGKDTIIAWYTPEIPVASGPQDIIGLPGLILEAHINKNISIIGSYIGPIEDMSSKIYEPIKGKKKTKAEYDQIVKEKEEEDRKDREKHKGMQIIIGH